MMSYENVPNIVRLMDEVVARNLRVCLVLVFENCFLFSKTRRIRKTGRTHLVHFFFFFLENTKNL